jgi:ABC-type transport system involved in multi-copper enzyme maturation permease subunit
MIGQISALAWNTFREAVRDRVLYSIFFFALGVILLSLAMEQIAIGDQAKVVRSMAQGSIDFFSAVIAMFLGISLVWKELERRTVYTILSKPIPRWTFVVGKYTGLVLTLAVQLLLMLVFYVVLMMFQTQQSFPPPVVFVSMGMVLMELMLLTAWATLFGCYSAPTTAAFCTLSVFIIGHLADDIWLFGSQAESLGVQQISRTLYWVLPNFEIFNIREAAVHGREVPWGRFWGALAYGLAYTSVVLGFAVGVFNRKDIK